MSLPVLLPDLIMEIISWLPVKPVVRFKCVSKHYNSLISDPEFAKLHLQRSPKNPYTLLTLRGLDDDEEDVDDDDEEIWAVTPYPVRHLIEHPSSVVKENECRRFKENNDYYSIGSINGLVCLIRKKEQKGGNTEIVTQFWNPTLRLRSDDSPNLTFMPNFSKKKKDRMLKRVNLGFGYDDSTDTYKVVVVFWDCTTEKWEGRVHCMGDSCWRKTLACPDFPNLLGSTLGPFVNGNINWLARHNLNCHLYQCENVTINQLVILSLDMRREACKYMLLPDGFIEVPKNEPTLDVLRGRLCLYYDNMRTHFVLWEMREFGVQESWTRLVNVSYVQLGIFENLDFVDWLLPVCLSESGDVMLLASKGALDDDVIMYNRRDDRVEDIELLDNQIWYADEHMQSLVLPRPHPH